MNSIKISFIIIAYNEEKTIKNCINGITNLENLNKDEIEIIVVNDGSVDKTRSVVEQLQRELAQIKLIDLVKNTGRGNARLIGIQRSVGDLIAFVDADIILPKKWLTKLSPHLNENDAVGGIALPDSDIEYAYYKSKLPAKATPATVGITGNNSLYKRDVFIKLSFNDKLQQGEDVDLFWKMLDAGKKIKLDTDVIVEHRSNKNYAHSMKRMFEHGDGATHLLLKYKKMRLPDINFFIYLALLILTIFTIPFRLYTFLILFLLYPFTTALIHIFTRFYIKKDISDISKFIYAGLVEYLLMVSYYVGRIRGFTSYKKVIS